MFCTWDAFVIVNVPEVVIGEPDTVNSAGVDNATLVTATPPVISAATNFLKTGTPDKPFGLAYTIFANCDAFVSVNVPAVVIGVPDTVNSAGADNATLVTATPPVISAATNFLKTGKPDAPLGLA